jgi:hypothetical protein
MTTNARPLHDEDRSTPVDRGDLETARRMEDTLRAAGRDDIADEIYAAGCAAGSATETHTRPDIRTNLAAGADLARGSDMIAARVVPSDAAYAVARFDPAGPHGYRSKLGGPLRATRGEAEADYIATVGP